MSNYKNARTAKETIALLIEDQLLDPAIDGFEDKVNLLTEMDHDSYHETFNHHNFRLAHNDRVGFAVFVYNSELLIIMVNDTHASLVTEIIMKDGYPDLTFEPIGEEMISCSGETPSRFFDSSNKDGYVAYTRFF